MTPINRADNNSMSGHAGSKNSSVFVYHGGSVNLETLPRHRHKTSCRQSERDRRYPVWWGAQPARVPMVSDVPADRAPQQPTPAPGAVRFHAGSAPRETSAHRQTRPRLSNCPNRLLFAKRPPGNHNVVPRSATLPPAISPASR